MTGLNLVLLGKTGAGKSASGNTILGRQAFISRKSPKSVTQDVSKKSNNVNGCTLTVYDTPGYFDTHLTEDEIQMKYQGLFQECESDPCVFLLVIQTGRFTEEERKTVERIEKLLGQNRLNKTWILFTGGDQLEDENMTIKEFINETEPLKKLVQKYDQRYHVFNNKKRGHRQVRSLFSKFQKFFQTLGARINPLKRKKKAEQKKAPKKAEQDIPDDSLSRRIVLLGKTGVGKSAAGNTILGQREFRSVMSTSSVTSKCLEKHNTVSGRSVSVVDTPGFFDTHMTHEELAKEIAKSVYISSPGPHAFLIVLRVDDRFTDQELQIPQMIEMMFGEEVLKYSIILFTHGDQVRGESVEKLIEENCRLRDVVDQCGGRFHVFNNRDENNRDQVNDLLQKIDTMIEESGGGHYSNQMLEDAQRLRREEEERRQREEEEREREEEKRKQREEDDRKQREEEEKKQQLEKNRKEIETVRKETEERVRAEIEATQKSDRERLQALIHSGHNETKNQEEPQEDTNDSVPPEQEPSSGFKKFWSEYRKYFYIAAGAIIGCGIIGGGIAAIIAGAVVGGPIVGGAIAIGGIVAGCAAIADAVNADKVNPDKVNADKVNPDKVNADS